MKLIERIRAAYKKLEVNPIHGGLIDINGDCCPMGAVYMAETGNKIDLVNQGIVYRWLEENFGDTALFYRSYDCYYIPSDYTEICEVALQARQEFPPVR